MGNKLTIDMTGEVYQDFTVIPAGIYPVQVVSVECKQKIGSTNKYLEWKLGVTFGEFDGKVLTSRTTLVKGRRWLYKQAMECFGVPKVNEKFTFDTDELVGKKCNVKVIIKKNKFTDKDGKEKEYEKNEVTQFLKSGIAKAQNTLGVSEDESVVEDDPQIPF